MDWAHWRDSGRSLEPQHPTVARDYEEAATEPANANLSSFEAMRRIHAGLLDQVRAAIQRRGFAIKTEQTYLHWILRFIRFLGDRDPSQGATGDTARFLDDLAVRRRVSASTQNLALNALVFLYRETLGHSDLEITEFTRARRPRRLPTVLTQVEVASLLQQLSGTQRLMAALMYGTGMRLMECSRLRVQDIDFGYGQITVRNAKGGKDRVVPLPDQAIEALRNHLERVKALHQTDLAEGFGEVYLPDALARKYPNAAREWRWQYVFPASQRSIDPYSGKERRHHLDEKVLQRAVKQAVRDAGLTKPASCHTLRHNPECLVMSSRPVSLVVAF